MDSTAAINGRAQFVPNKTNTPFSTRIRPSSRRTPSLSSNSSFESISSPNGNGNGNGNENENSPFSPTSPLRFSGIPFSWEKLPGIPKQQDSKKKDPSLNLLPLPPAGNSFPSGKFNRKETSSPIKNKYYLSDSFRKDPFFAALVECSKDDHGSIGNIWKGSRVNRTLSDRFGFMSMYTSCKTTSAVAGSIVYLPRSNRSGSTFHT